MLKAFGVVVFCSCRDLHFVWRTLAWYYLPNFLLSFPIGGLLLYSEQYIFFLWDSNIHYPAN